MKHTENAHQRTLHELQGTIPTEELERRRKLIAEDEKELAKKEKK
jgi:hypothetical protein